MPFALRACLRQFRQLERRETEGGKGYLSNPRALKSPDVPVINDMYANLRLSDLSSLTTNSDSWATCSSDESEDEINPVEPTAEPQLIEEDHVSFKGKMILFPFQGRLKSLDDENHIWVTRVDRSIGLKTEWHYTESYNRIRTINSLNKLFVQVDRAIKLVHYWPKTLKRYLLSATTWKQVEYPLPLQWKNLAYLNRRSRAIATTD